MPGPLVRSPLGLPLGIGGCYPSRTPSGHRGGGRGALYPYAKDVWILYLGVSIRTGGNGQYVPGAAFNSGYTTPLISLVCACGLLRKGGVASNR